MIRKNLILFFAAAAVTATAQRPAPDLLLTAAGNISIQPIHHGSIVFSLNEKTIYVDPYNGAQGYRDIKPPTLVLITDIHPDHLDTATLRVVNSADAKLIVPQAVFDKLPEIFRNKAYVLRNGDSIKTDGLTITAVPMYNMPESPAAMHTKGRGNGYLLRTGGKTIYVSGDTGNIPEMRALKNIDVAFVCMNLPYTMNVDDAAKAVLSFAPRIVYPYHYRGKEGLSDTSRFAKLIKEGNRKIEVRLRNWY